ncbi:MULTISPECIES: EamA family transporter [Chitinophagaceae]
MSNKPTPLSYVLVAFAIVYVVWGSTYFFIQNALKGFTPMEIGAFRFVTAGTILLAWCKTKHLKIFNWQQIKVAGIAGLLLLFIDNGLFIWAEQYVPSSLAAIMASGVSLWFILLDKRKWKENLGNRYIIMGLVLGLMGILFLFGEQLSSFFSGSIGKPQVIALIVLSLAPATWAIGSLYSKYNTTESNNIWVSVGWQMLVAGIAFSIGGFVNGDFKTINWQTIPKESIASVVYLIFFGSLGAYSSYIWLLKVRSAMQVSTHAYVNPVIAVLLGCLFGHESISLLQIVGLAIILLSVFFINMSSIWVQKRRSNRQQISVS